MKTVTVSIRGEVEVYWADHIKVDLETFDDYIGDGLCFNELEDEGVLDADSLNELSFLMYDIEIEVDGHSITEKGKDIKNKEYLENLLKRPTYIIGGYQDDSFEEEYIIELEDDADFDPLKLQLVKSDYDVTITPCGIITQFIYYDGKRVEREGLYQCPVSFIEDDADIIQLLKGGIYIDI